MLLAWATGGSRYAVSKYAVRGFSEHLMMQCRAIAPHITVTCVHPGAIITEIARKNLNMPEVDDRLLEELPPWDRTALLAVPEGEARVAALKAIVTKSFDQFGLTAPKAAAVIFEGVRRKQTRVLVGWDAAIMDLWVRLFPRIFATKSGQALLMGSAVVGQHLLVPTAVALMGAGLFFFRSSM